MYEDSVLSIVSLPPHTFLGPRIKPPTSINCLHISYFLSLFLFLPDLILTIFSLQTSKNVQWKAWKERREKTHWQTKKVGRHSEECDLPWKWRVWLLCSILRNPPGHTTKEMLSKCVSLSHSLINSALLHATGRANARTQCQVGSIYKCCSIWSFHATLLPLVFFS